MPVTKAAQNKGKRTMGPTGGQDSQLCIYRATHVGVQTRSHSLISAPAPGASTKRHFRRSADALSGQARLQHQPRRRLSRTAASANGPSTSTS